MYKKLKLHHRYDGGADFDLDAAVFMLRRMEI